MLAVLGKCVEDFQKYVLPEAQRKKLFQTSGGWFLEKIAMTFFPLRISVKP